MNDSRAGLLATLGLIAVGVGIGSFTLGMFPDASHALTTIGFIGASVIATILFIDQKGQP